MNISDQVATQNVNLAVIQFWPGIDGPEPSLTVVYAVLGVCWYELYSVLSYNSWLLRGEIESDYLTLCL
jgi:hypothetical protein